jgi:glucosamine--fructose-6-phosphate aminotransferase (isomerizing)
VRAPVQVDIGSEFRYRNPLIGKNDLLVAISQSGETADTLAAIREARKQGARVVSICNVVGSSLVRESDGILYTHAGPEIGVASTKAFTAQLTALYLLALHLGRVRGVVSEQQGKAWLDRFVTLPTHVQHLLDREAELVSIAKRYHTKRNFLYLGRGINYPIALEGALKLKEISYIHAEGYAAGEMKHGPIALIDKDMPVVMLAPRDRLYEKTVSNLMEVKARGAPVIALVTGGERELGKTADAVFTIPDVHPLMSPILFTVPLQLLAYHIAVLRGTDVDQPRNLAKSVTVE